MKNFYIAIIITIIHFSFAANVQCQLKEKPRLHFSFTSDANKFLSSSIDVLKSPFNYEVSDWNMLSTIFVSSLASISLDNKVRSNLHITKSKTMDDITYYGEKFGRPLYAGILSALMYGGGYIFKDEYVKDTGQILAEAMLLNGFYTLALKVMFGRARPYAGDGKLDFDFLLFQFDANENSFPSGHTSTAFTIATVLSERFNNIYASVFLYSMASLTAFQRMYDDKHWFSDTVLGAALGTCIGLRVVRLYEQKSESNNGMKFNLFPSFSANNPSISISLQF